ncbi:hypothetical protein ACOME3_009599 [Neoechinorhynchus agilis]
MTRLTFRAFNIGRKLISRKRLDFEKVRFALDHKRAVLFFKFSLNPLLIMLVPVVNGQNNDDGQRSVETSGLSLLDLANKFDECSSLVNLKRKLIGLKYNVVIETKVAIVLQKYNHSRHTMQYAVIGRFEEVSSHMFFMVQCDLQYRKSWDANALSLNIVGSSDDGDDIVHWICSYPGVKEMRVDSVITNNNTFYLLLIHKEEDLDRDNETAGLRMAEAMINRHDRPSINVKYNEMFSVLRLYNQL